MKRKICVVISARPSYSRIKSAMQAIQAHPNLELQVVVCASALLSKYGSAVDIIEADGFTIHAKVYMVFEGENSLAMAKTTGIGILELATVFNNLAPDAVVVIADRFETLSISVAAAYQNIPLIHIQGGEVTGNIDEKVRHANTKLADIHLVSTEDARLRVLKMGEDEAYTINTGCPSIDLAATALKNNQNNVIDLYKKYGGVGATPNYSKGYYVVMQHPVTTEYDQSRKHIEETLYAVAELDKPVFWFWPNMDAGADGTATGLRSFRERFALDKVHFFKNMEPIDFLHLLNNAEALIGNSSVGIRECAFMGVPVINIGSRQHKRERGENVIDVNYDRTEILVAIKQIEASERPKPSYAYGDGQAGKKIAETIATIPLRYHKTITY